MGLGEQARSSGPPKAAEVCSLVIGTLETWRRLYSPEMVGLRDSGLYAGSGVAEIERFRGKFPAALVAVAIELGEARRRAGAKFGENAASALIADRAGVEMASSAAVADHKAARFVRVSGAGATVADFCCGIGGDAMALTRAGLDVIGVDADPIRAWMCSENAGCQAVVGHAEDDRASPHTPWFHLDPARRIEGSGARRVFRLEDLSPGPDAWRTVIERSQRCASGGKWGGAIKLGPGVDPNEVRCAIGERVPLEMEYISQDGRMSQAVAWRGGGGGGLAGEQPLRATAVSGTRVHTLTGEAGDPPIGQVGSHLVEADDAVERAGLLGVICRTTGLRGFCTGLGLLTADGPGATPMVSSFEVLAQMPWNERRVAAYLRDHDGGIVEVKTRAGAADTDALQGRLRGIGAIPHTLFVLRLGRAMSAFITRRL